MCCGHGLGTARSRSRRACSSQALPNAVSCACGIHDAQRRACRHVCRRVVPSAARGPGLLHIAAITPAHPQIDERVDWRRQRIAASARRPSSSSSSSLVRAFVHWTVRAEVREQRRIAAERLRELRAGTSPQRARARHRPAPVRCRRGRDPAHRPARRAIAAGRTARAMTRSSALSDSMQRCSRSWMRSLIIAAHARRCSMRCGRTPPAGSWPMSHIAIAGCPANSPSIASIQRTHRLEHERVRVDVTRTARLRDRVGHGAHPAAPRIDVDGVWREHHAPVRASA